MDTVELVKTLASKVYGMPDAEITSTLLKVEGENTALVDNAIDLLLDRDVKKIKAIKDAHAEELTTQFNNGHKKGKAESLDDWEKTIRDTFKYEGQEKGVDLIKNLLKAHVKSSPDKDIKLTPEYLDLEKQLRDIEAEWKTKYDKDIEAIKGEYTRKEILTTINNDALDIVLTAKPVNLSENPIIRDTQIKNFTRELAGYDYQLGEQREHVISENGKRKDDPHGKPYKFTELVMDVAKRHFEFGVQDQKGGGGNGGSGATPPGTNGIPTDIGEFQKLIANTPDPNKRKEYWDAWEKAHK
ncbi:MAG: hypothetical protein WC341_07770 [Bacteroidales bacterium]|jgi:hypothetical protein